MLSRGRDVRASTWALGFALLAVLLYAPSLGYGFVNYDDYTIYLGQKSLFAGTWGEGLWAIFTELPREEPLWVRDLSWLIDSQFFGFGNPLGLHLGNVLAYGATCAMVFILLERLGLDRPLVIASTLLFVVHPVHIEPVAWIMGRKDLLSTALALLASVLWLDVVRAPERRGLVVACTVTSALAVLSKVNIVVLPGIFLFLGLYERRRMGLSASRAHVLAWFAICVAVMVPFAGYQWSVGSFGILERSPGPLDPRSWSELPALVPAELATYARHLLIPWDYQIYYDRPKIGVEPSLVEFVMGSMVGLGLVVTGVLGWRRRPLVSVLVGAGLLALLPYLNLKYIGIVCANRYLLFPSVFFLPLVVLAARALLRALPNGWKIVLGLGVVWAGVATGQFVRQLPAFSKSAALWDYELSVGAPSLNAYASWVDLWLEQVELREDHEERRQMLEEIATRAREGIRAFEVLDPRPVEGFVNYGLGYGARLHYLLARTETQLGAPLGRRLELLEAADELFPEPTHPGLPALTQAYFLLAQSHEAGPERDAALTRCLAVLRRSATDPEYEEGARAAAAVIANRFPQIRAELVDMGWLP